MTRAPKVIRLEQVDGGTVTFRNDVPATRADCPTQRPCPHHKCRHNLNTINDSGYPWHGPRFTLRAWWLEEKTPESCTFDLVERARATKNGGMNTEEMAAVFGCDKTLVRRRVREALESLKAAGVDVSEWQLLIDEEELKRDC